MTSPGYTSHTFTIFPSKRHNAYSVLPYKYSNMANMAMYRENVHTWEILLIRPYHSCLPMYTHVQLSRQLVICSCSCCDETEEGGEVSLALNDRNTYCKEFNSLCSEVTVCLAKYSDSENSLNVVEQLFLQILHTTLGCCRPPGESNT